MRRRRVRTIGLICALVGALCLFSGVFQIPENRQAGLAIISMGSTLAAVSWLCLMAVRRPKRRRPKQTRSVPRRKEST